MLLHALSMFISELENIMIKNNIYLGLIYLFLVLLIELRIKELESLPKSLVNELSEPLSQNIIKHLESIPEVKLLNEREFYPAIMEILQNNNKVRIISKERPVDNNYILQIITQLENRPHTFMLRRINVFKLDYLVWLVEQALLTETYANIKYYLLDYPVIGLILGKEGTFSKAILILSRLEETGPSPAIKLVGKNNHTERIIDEWWGYSNSIINSSTLIKDIKDLKRYIENKIKENPSILDDIDGDIIRKDIHILNKMNPEYVKKVMDNLKKIVNDNEPLKKRLIALGINIK